MQDDNLPNQDKRAPRRSSSIFFIEVDKIRPNPYRPRKEFDDIKLSELAESIRQYGVLQPLVVVRKEISTPSGGVTTEYELIAGERRLRASRLAGLREVPVVIREDFSEKVKLELAIVENVQREDLNPLDRALAFKKLFDEFKLAHKDIAKRIGKSREYVSNSIRLLGLPQDMLDALRNGKITEGHTRPLLMLVDREAEQRALFKDILNRNLSVREAEKMSREVAQDRARRKDFVDPEIKTIENKFREALGTRVLIEKKGNGGRISIDYFSEEDLRALLGRFSSSENAPVENNSAKSAEPAPLLSGSIVSSEPNEPPQNIATLASTSFDPLISDEQMADSAESHASKKEMEDFTI